jgi:hypothetical protein
MRGDEAQWVAAKGNEESRGPRRVAISIMVVEQLAR